MKTNRFLLGILLLLLGEIAALLFFAAVSPSLSQDAVAVNQAVQSVLADWKHLETHQPSSDLDYVVLDMDGAMLFRSKEGLSETLHAAVVHRDTILDLQPENSIAGKIIIYNSEAEAVVAQKQMVTAVLASAIFVQGVLCMGYLLYINRTVIKPFSKLKGFAQRVANGNLDIPLEMDRHNLFGAFTESFDVMRAELKRARMAEAQANTSKKELVAKLSHDIKTPVASIKAASEIGYALADSEKRKQNYRQIIQKADQINVLVSNLFTATIEELQQLTVHPCDIDSREVKLLLEQSDYMDRASIPELPECLLFADRLRLQQVFDNLFVNSYKYADTKIEVSVWKEEAFLNVRIEDYGGGVAPEELPLLTEKFKRGSNVRDQDGAGLGLYISDYFMREMKGKLLLENGKQGLAVLLKIRMSGKI